MLSWCDIISLISLNSFFVVAAIHIRPMLSFSETMDWYFNTVFPNMAVPFFFITSGFLLFSQVRVASATQNEIHEAHITYICHLVSILDTV